MNISLPPDTRTQYLEKATGKRVYFDCCGMLDVDGRPEPAAIYTYKTINPLAEVYTRPHVKLMSDFLNEFTAVGD